MDDMAEYHHKEPYHHVIMDDAWIEEAPGEVHGENLEVGPEGYQEDPTNWLRSLEEEVAMIRQQPIAAETRAALAEPRAEEVNREMSKMAKHLVCYFNIWASLHYPHYVLGLFCIFFTTSISKTREIRPPRTYEIRTRILY